MAEFEKKNALIFGVSFDTEAENTAFSEKFGFNFPLLCDTDRALGLAYGACEAVDAGHAKRVGVLIGADGRIREYAPSVDAAQYPAQILALL